MREAGIAFAKAAQSKGAQEIKTAAGKVNATCNNCHSVFKE
jgi:cytochrome c556